MNPPRIRWVLILGLVSMAVRLDGQSTEERAPEPGAQRGGRVLPVVGIRYGAPLGASVYGGFVLGDPSPDFHDGPSLMGEVGQDGMRVSLGVSSVSLGGTFRGQASLIRTWDSHGGVQADQTYVGPEIAVGLIAGITIGHYWRIGDGGGKARVLAIGSFIGF